MQYFHTFAHIAMLFRKDVPLHHLCHVTSMLMLTAIMLFRFVATELATDIVISIGDVKFYLHKVATSVCFTHY